MKRRLDNFLPLNLAVELDYKVCFASVNQMQVFLPLYIDWYNSLRYKDKQPSDEANSSVQDENKMRKENLKELITQLAKILQSNE